MGEVIYLSGPKFRPLRVELFDGILGEATISDAAGSHVVADNVGRRSFFVDLVEADGGRVSLWDGFDYAEAILAGTDSANDFGVPFKNMVGGA